MQTSTHTFQVHLNCKSKGLCSAEVGSRAIWIVFIHWLLRNLHIRTKMIQDSLRWFSVPVMSLVAMFCVRIWNGSTIVRFSLNKSATSRAFQVKSVWISCFPLRSFIWNDSTWIWPSCTTFNLCCHCRVSVTLLNQSVVRLSAWTCCSCGWSIFCIDSDAQMLCITKKQSNL